jgi:hypothetical protein
MMITNIEKEAAKKGPHPDKRARTNPCKGRPVVQKPLNHRGKPGSG